MISILQDQIANICKSLYGYDTEVELTRPEVQFGDLTTNVCLKLAKQLNMRPQEIAEAVSRSIAETIPIIAEAKVAGPGFINLTLADEALIQLADQEPTEKYKGQVVVAEYSDPNPFKVLHAGHLYTSIVGDAIANLLEVAGAEVHRVNFGGDVGLHVGRTMWAIIDRLGGEYPDKLADVPEADRPSWLSEVYVIGNNAYEDSEEAKAQIIDYNKKVYDLHNNNDHESPFAQIYWTTRQWSYDYFNEFYDQIGVHFEKYYPESETAPLGLETVKEHIGDVYEQSDGAVIFNGEKYGLHTRVFINSEGLPTYEAKDVGLIMKKWQDYKFDQSVVITGNDIIDYMKVVLRSVEMFMPKLPKRTKHLTHGIVKLAGGKKMSSRKGNFLKAADVLDYAAQANEALTGKQDRVAVLGAVKYAFLKSRLGGDIIYDPKESVSTEGNSGPYLQYAHARARSILRNVDNSNEQILGQLDDSERLLVRKLSESAEVIERSIDELLPHHICTYLYELAQAFNRFYENSRVIGDPRESTRLALVQLYADRLKSGLNLLGIDAPDHM
ncbi:MAG TPA: arginine--tRNA ligase [Candidatus Saccharimonadales bacterium]|nr:arginine--tRNA ligase [Candidatus Saccharimonadales bacterium]